LAKKLGTPNYFDYYAYGKGSGVTPDLFKQYSGGEVGKKKTTNLKSVSKKKFQTLKNVQQQQA
jgi:hypothetical protein